MTCVDDEWLGEQTEVQATSLEASRKATFRPAKKARKGKR